MSRRKPVPRARLSSGLNSSAGTRQLEQLVMNGMVNLDGIARFEYVPGKRTKANKG